MEEIRKKVSCHVITYNHINYISQCIDGILMQQTNFDFEIVIGDDLSTDGTREVLQKYALEYPDLIKLNLRKERGIGVPGKENFVSTLKMCNGQYISLCDGDDYWTDPLKLQKQVDFLESNNEYVLCFHKVEILKEDGKIVADYITTVPENFQERRTLAMSFNYIHTPTVLFKNVGKLHLSSFEFLKSPIGDYFSYLYISQYGKIGFINESMAVYRHGSGIYSKLNELKHNKANLLLYLNLYSFEKDPIIKEIFYNHMLNFLNPTYDKLQKNASLLGTRRHLFVERLYVFTRKILNSVKKR